MSTLSLDGKDATCLSFSPKGSTLAVGDETGTIRIWAIASGEIKATIKNHSEVVRSVAYTSDGTVLGSASDDGTIKVWDVAMGRQRISVRSHSGLLGIAFGAGDTILTSVSRDGTVKLWDVATAREEATLKSRLDILDAVSFSPDGATVALGGPAGRIELLSLAKRRPITMHEAMLLTGCQLEGLCVTPRPELAYVGRHDFVALGDHTFARSVAPPSEVNSLLRVRWSDRNPNKWVTGARREDVEALYNLAVIRERRCRDAEARELHRKAAAFTDPKQRKWADESRWRLDHVPWLQRWYSAYIAAAESFESADYEAGMKAYAEAQGLSKEERAELGQALAVQLRQLAHVHSTTKAHDRALRERRIAVEMDPEARAYAELGRTFEGMGDKAEAIEQYRCAIELKTEEGQVHHGLAQLLKGRGDYSEAAKVLKQWLDRDDGDIEARAQLLDALCLAGRHDEAREALQRFVPSGERPAPVKSDQSARDLADRLADLANSNLNNKAHDAAEQLCRMAAELDGSNADVRNLLGIAVKRKGDRDGAIGEYRRALAADPDHDSAHYNLALSLEEGGAFEEAIRHYRKSARLSAAGDEFARQAIVRSSRLLTRQKRRDEAMQVLQEWIKRDKEDTGARAELVDMLCLAGRHEDALHVVDSLLTGKSGLAADDRRQLAEAMADQLTDIALAHGKEERYDEAEHLCRLAVRLHPESERTHALWGLVLKVRGDEDGAIGKLRRAIEANKDFSLAHYELAMLLERKGMTEEAIAHYRKKVSLSSEEEDSAREAVVKLSRLLAKQGSQDEAMQVLQEWIKKDEKDAGARAELVDMLCSAGRGQDARKLLQPFLAAEGKPAPEKPDQQAKDLVDHLVNLARAHRDRKAYDKAEQLCRLAMDVYPASADTHNALGLALGGKGDEEGAITQYRRAIEANADSRAPHYNLAMLLEKRGKTDEAIVHYRKMASLSEAGDKFARRATVWTSRLLARGGGQKEAIQTLEQWLRKDPQDTAAVTELAVCLYTLGRHEDSLERLEPLLTGERPGEKAALTGAVCAHVLGDQEKAAGLLAMVFKGEVGKAADGGATKGGESDGEARRREAIADLLEAGIDIEGLLNESLRSTPNLAERFRTCLALGYVTLACRRAEMGEKSQAQSACHKALELAPKVTDVQRRAGWIFGELAMHDLAVSCYSKAAEMEPDNATLHGNLGWALYEAGRYQEAMAASQRALALDGTLAWVHANVGLLHVIDRDLGKATASYEMALGLEPKEMQTMAVDDLLDLLKKNADTAEAHYALGFCYEKKGDKGDKKAAVQHYEKYVQAVPEGEFAKRAQEKIAELNAK